MTWGGRSSHEVKSASKCVRLPLLCTQSSRRAGTVGCIRGVPWRISRDFWPCGSCVHPTSFLNTLLQNELFGGYPFSFGCTPVFVVFSVVIVVVLNFFQPKSKTVKTKMVRDQKLVENADRIFKRFLARFPRCGWFNVSDFQTAASREPGKKRLKNAIRVLY